MAETDRKIYLYVDETGQDTAGKLFVVAVVVGDSSRGQLEEKLLKIEKSSGKCAKKWQKTRKREQINYIKAVLAAKESRRVLYYKLYLETGKQYLPLIIYALRELIAALFKGKKISVTIDALTKKGRRAVAVSLRRLGVKIDAVRGKRDESSALLRSADALAGFVRDGIEGRSDFNKIFVRAVERGIIKKVK